MIIPIFEKIELIEKGINLNLYKEPFQQTTSRASVCNGIFLKYNNNISLKTRINDKSNYYLISKDKNLQIIDNKERIFLKNVKLIQNELKSGIFTEQLSGIIATNLYGCQLVNENKSCKFCSIEKYSGFKFSKNYFENDLEKILKRKKFNSLTINGGSFPKLKYKGYELMQGYVKIANKKGIKKINLEIMPNQDLTKKEINDFFNEIKKDGITSVQVNLEIWEKEKRKKIMPYKGLIPRETYLEYLKEGSKILGEGKLSSVLLIGLNNEKELSEGLTEIIKNKGIPSIEIFRALPETELKDFTIKYNLKEIEKIMKKINNQIKYKTLEGCLKCNGCSLTKGLK
ncbi:MAG: hypothetical protein U9Q99_03320 [Nanoarchaeota archaeon]|nr:hypothetical protein [Nanoarchaeota archaeon]